MLQAPRIVRWTLPALLLTLVVGGSLIVAASGRQDGGATGSAVQTTKTSAKPKRKKVKRVRVRSGDTATKIAHRAKLSVVELLELNPDVDPRALRAGQRLKIKP